VQAEGNKGFFIQLQLEADAVRLKRTLEQPAGLLKKEKSTDPLDF